MKFKPGDRVIFTPPFEGSTSDYGIVISTWENVNGDEDCYVAFFGPDGFPTGKPTSWPCVLRYYAASLELADAAPVAEAAL